VGVREDESVRAWKHVEARPLPVDELGERYRRYRLADPAADEAMADRANGVAEQVLGPDLRADRRPT
jgi:hypothetical protein